MPESAAQDEKFQAWLQRVDQAMWDQFGCSYQDLPDWDFWAAFEQGTSPSRAAKQIFKHAQTF